MHALDEAGGQRYVTTWWCDRSAWPNPRPVAVGCARRCGPAREDLRCDTDSQHSHGNLNQRSLIGSPAMACGLLRIQGRANVFSPIVFGLA